MRVIDIVVDVTLAVLCVFALLMCLLVGGGEWLQRELRPVAPGRHRAPGRATWASTRELRAARAQRSLCMVAGGPGSAAALAAAPPAQRRYEPLAPRVLAAQAYVDRRALLLGQRPPVALPATADMWESDLAGVT